MFICGDVLCGAMDAVYISTTISNRIESYRIKLNLVCVYVCLFACLLFLLNHAAYFVTQTGQSSLGTERRATVRRMTSEWPSEVLSASTKRTSSSSGSGVEGDAHKEDIHESTRSRVMHRRKG